MDVRIRNADGVEVRVRARSHDCGLRGFKVSRIDREIHAEPLTDVGLISLQAFD